MSAGEAQHESVFRFQALVSDPAHPVGAECDPMSFSQVASCTPGEPPPLLVVSDEGGPFGRVRCSTALALGELWALAGLLEAILLAFDGPGVPRQEPRALQLAARIL